MTRWASFALIVAAAAALRPDSTGACNLCIEDKIAATYDWDLAREATRAGHVIVFTEIHGPLGPKNGALEHEIARRLAAVPGVDRGSVRVSLEPAAASFACAPAHQLPQRLVAAVSRAIATRGLSASLIRVGVPGEVVRPASGGR